MNEILKAKNMINILGKESSILNQFIAELRDAGIQKDRMRFRANMERVGGIIAYEISKTLSYEEQETITPLGIASTPLLKEYPIVVSILRAGLPLHQGILNVFDGSDNGFISAYRKHKKDGSFSISLEYISCPNIEGKVIILADPMIATGSSVLMSYKALMEKGKPRHMHIVAVVASTQGIKHIRQNLPPGVTLWVGAVDDELTAQSYIVPGLGDAGDLAYGTKEYKH